ncbi:MAG TPA: serine O-acetyltransferase [Acidobacteriaceae bacterium]|jgi:serine O-acetyltransferase|nr:serine O-acetyltransferase [Acidobacteriaceae bacterium]
MKLLQSIREDVQSVSERDPAAASRAMVLLCYPGLHAVWSYRIYHRLWCKGWKLLARLLSQGTRFCTGVEIHPGAQIGRRLFIDHGMGVVIGETAVLGDDITLYQGVTLGGTGHGEGKRHPTLRNRVYVGNNANILGNIILGENARVGAGSVVLRDVPPDSTVVGVPAHIVYQAGKRVLVTDPHEIHDPLSDVIIALADEVKRLAARIEQLDRLDGAQQQDTRQEPASALTVEKEESAQYRSEQLARIDTVTMGEGI